MKLYDALDASGLANHGKKIAAQCTDIDITVELVENGDYLIDGQRFCLTFDAAHYLNDMYGFRSSDEDWLPVVDASAASQE